VVSVVNENQENAKPRMGRGVLREYCLFENPLMSLVQSAA